VVGFSVGTAAGLEEGGGDGSFAGVAWSRVVCRFKILGLGVRLGVFG
jgi:hypothetical protein